MKNSYPWCKVIEKIIVKKQRLATFLNDNSISLENHNFWNLEYQGSELAALKSADHHINFADAIYSEINIEHVYKNCGLLSEMDSFL